jgi:hypothetical protein
VGGGVVVRTPQGSGGAEQELNRMQETMDGLQVRHMWTCTCLCVCKAVSYP